MKKKKQQRTKKKTPVNNSNNVEDILLDMPFEFEEMKETWQAIGFEERKRLMKLGPHHPERMTFVDTIHAVHQSPDDVQITITDELSNTPHGHTCGPFPSPEQMGGVPIRVVPPVQEFSGTYNKVQHKTIKNKSAQKLLFECIPKIDEYLAKHGEKMMSQDRETIWTLASLEVNVVAVTRMTKVFCQDSPSQDL